MWFDVKVHNAFSSIKITPGHGHCPLVITLQINIALAAEKKPQPLKILARKMEKQEL